MNDIIHFFQSYFATFDVKLLNSKSYYSRTIGKASSEMKLYFSVPEAYRVFPDLSADLCSNKDGDASLETLLNSRASYLSGQAIYGDAILVNVGYTWKSPNLFYEDVYLCTYYRSVMVLGSLQFFRHLLLIFPWKSFSL